MKCGIWVHMRTRLILCQTFSDAKYMLPKNWGEPVRTALGQTRMFAERIDLVHALPSGNLSSTGYCLAVPGKEYLVYAPAAGQFRVRLFGARGPFSVEWFNPNTGETIPGEPFEGGTAFDFTPPYLGRGCSLPQKKSEKPSIDVLCGSHNHHSRKGKMIP